MFNYGLTFANQILINRKYKQMKQFMKSLLAITAVMIMTASASNAQKIGHINLQDLVKDMPETKKVQDSLASIQQTWELILKDGQTELERKYNEINTNKTWTAAQRALKEKDFEELRAKLERTNQQAQEEIQEKQTTLQEPVYEKAKKIINEVAKELGYTTVINSTGGYVLLVASASDDLMSAVKKKMGLSDKPTNVVSPITPRK